MHLYSICIYIRLFCPLADSSLTHRRSVKRCRFSEHPLASFVLSNNAASPLLRGPECIGASTSCTLNAQNFRLAAVAAPQNGLQDGGIVLSAANSGACVRHGRAANANPCGSSRAFPTGCQA